MEKSPCDGIITVDRDSPASEKLMDDFEEPCKYYVRRKRTTQPQAEEIECLTLLSPVEAEPCKQYARRKKTRPQQDDEIECLTLLPPCSVKSIPRNRKLTMRNNGQLDSSAFETYFKDLWSNFSEDKKSCFTYFECLWFSIYMTSPCKENMLAWVKDRHIFTKTYVLVPIVYWSHWSLLIFCNFGESSESENRTPCMLLLDSLQMAGPKRLEPGIRKLVLDIFRSEGRPESKQSISKIPLLVPKVPQQRNGEECGNYVLYFIDLFVRNAPGEFSMKSYPYFMTKEWFNLESLDAFCKKLKPPRTVIS